MKTQGKRRLHWLRFVVVTLSLVLTGGTVFMEAGPAQAATVNYYLPYTAGSTAVMTQGPGGNVSHNNIYNQDAYDFDLSDGAVRASAPGTIIAKATNVTGQTGPGSSGNNVVLKHADNTCTRYAHMAYGSITTKNVGTTVAQAEQIGSEGNTGYTLPVGGGHHLHFQRENCSNITTSVDFVENNWTSQNSGTPPTEPDADADGVSDGSDACPTQPGPSSTGGCPDGDGDWVRDSQDLCDLVKGTASNHGCPNSVTQVSGDLDGDGKDDVIAISRNLDNSPGISWLRPTSAGSPSLADPVGLLSLTAPAWNVDNLKWAAGDFNADGKDDLFAASGSGAGQVVMYMFLSTGTGLSGPTLVKMPPHPGWQWDRLEYFAGDPDGDGKDDIIAVSRGMDNAPGISLLRSTSVGTTAALADPTSLKSMPGPAWHVDYLKWAVGDFDGDGKDDLFAASGSVSDPVSMYIFRSTGTTLADPILVKQPSFAAWKWDRLTFMSANVDGDSKHDVVAISRDYDNSAGIHWFQSTSSPSSMSLANSAFLRSVPAPAWNMGRLKWAVTDNNGDGKDDIFVASGSLSDPVSMYIFQAGGVGVSSTLGTPVLVKQPPYPGWQWVRLQF